MPQLDLVTFPSQVFWLTIFFLSFYAFVSGHFVPLLHKIIRVRSKKIEKTQPVEAGVSADSNVFAGTEGLVLKTLDKSVTGLFESSQELGLGQQESMASDNKSVASLAKTVASIQVRFFFYSGFIFIFFF
jgi:hypothetical protein